MIIPAAHEDELFYSLMARFFRIWPSVNRRECFSLLGFPGRTLPFVFLPPADLKGAFVGVEWLSLDELRCRLTLLPLWEKQGLSKSPVRRPSGALGASSVDQHQAKMACEDCFRLDDQIGRERYWRRLHQVPAVEVCAIHGCRLVRTGFDARTEIGVPQSADEAKTHIRDGAPVSLGASRLAQRAQLVLQGAPELSIYKGIAGYRESLAGLGFRKNAWHLDHRAIRDAVGEFYGEAFLARWGLQYDSEDINSWFRGINSRAARNFHPAQHLLLSTFIAHFGDSRPRYDSSKCHFSWLGGRHHLKMNWRTTAFSRVVSISCVCGAAYTSRAANRGKLVVSRIRSFGGEALQHIKTQSAAGLSARALARAMAVPRNSILRALRSRS